MQGVVADVVTAVQQAALELGKTPAQVAIAWVLAHPEITCAISGADTTDQLNDVLGGVGWELPGAIRQRLDEVSSAVNMVLD
jgi:aryl-alcohol dehydrogenase-like predicted oxidoreductase